MRLAAYAGTSALVAAGALLKAFHQRPNFYSATVYLSQSNACVLILTNLALVGACSFIYGLQRLFYGPLRPVEIEQLSEKAWYAVLDTLLAMPSLRDEVGGWMLATFVLLLAGKVWSWIGEGRVDILEQQPPQNPRLFHARLSSSLLLSVAFNAFMFHYCLSNVLDDPRPGMMVIFTFEFAIMNIFSAFTLSRYVLALCEVRILQLQTKVKMEERRAEIRAERERLQRERAEASDPQTLPGLPNEEDIDENEIDVPGWEEKRRWLFGLELATDFVKLIIYTVFFAISLTFMGLPMHIIRDVYLTFSSFVKRVQDYNNYRKATQNMNSRYPDATAEELGNDNTCIVCREVMLPWEQPGAAAGDTPRPNRMNEGSRAKKLPCGHILHLKCLKAWLERQQACPTCRRPVIPSGSSTTSQAQADAQNGAPGAGQGPAPDANAQANAGDANGGRQNRLRMINLGPIRIGVYNGPAHQVQDALAQRGAQQDETRATPQNTASAATPGGLNGGALTGDMQHQFMQLEERLMREARSLQIQASQLGNVRALEAELARLRASHDLNQAGLGATGVPNAAGTGGPSMPNFFPQPNHTNAPMGHMLPQAFQPPSGQPPLTAGHNELPPGLVLPEGWTLTPLRRIEAREPPFPSGRTADGLQGTQSAPPMPIPHPHQRSGSSEVTTVPQVPAMPSDSSDGAPAASNPATGLNAANASPATQQDSEEGRSESTDLGATGERPSESTGLAATEERPANPATGTTITPAQVGFNGERTGRNGSGEGSNWGFDHIDDNAAPQANGEEQQASSSNKGKGRAVTVEDAEEAEEQ